MTATTSFGSRNGFDRNTMLPDLLRVYPRARKVFDRYGLRGCGGPLGPVESIGFFAQAHGVDEARLLGELRQAVAEAAPAQAPAMPLDPPAIADTIYRRFFTAGILLVLTAGATWGAWLLWKIGLAGKFAGAGLQDVNAHGHAQIYGWVGLFIMGFGYQAFPRLWHTDLVAPRLAVGAFISMLAGLAVRTVAMTLSGSWDLALPTALLGGALEAAAVLIFAVQIVATFRRSLVRMEPYIGFIFVALFWFIAQSAMDLWHTYTTMTSSAEQLIWYVATYQAPLRDLQIHGLALFMILGVSLRKLPGIYGLPAISARRAWWALGALTVAVVGEVGLFIAYRWNGSHLLAALLLLPWLMMAAGVGLIVLPWRLWRPTPVAERTGKFVRAAYGWLAISLLMLLFLPVYLNLSGRGFSHAYYGATRHAITVGFVSMMIMGIAAKVVPMLNGVDARRLTSLWGPFVLINVGCFLRVSTQILTDRSPQFFPLIGISGTLEVIALAWWGIGLVRIMQRGKLAELSGGTEDAPDRHPPPPGWIEPTHIVADVLEWFPATAEVFRRHGFSLLDQPLLRRTVAKTVTLQQAAKLRGVDLTTLVLDVNKAARLVPEPAARQRPLKVLSIRYTCH